MSLSFTYVPFLIFPSLVFFLLLLLFCRLFSASPSDIEPFRLKYDVSTAAKLTQQENSLVELRNYEMYKAGSCCCFRFACVTLQTTFNVMVINALVVTPHLTSSIKKRRHFSLSDRGMSTQCYTSLTIVNPTRNESCNFD